MLVDFRSDECKLDGLQATASFSASYCCAFMDFACDQELVFDSAGASV